MSADIDLAKKLGIRYLITPSGIEELYGTVQDMQVFADAIRLREIVRTVIIHSEVREHYHKKALRQRSLLKEIFERSEELSLPPDLLERVRSELTYEFDQDCTRAQSTWRG